MKLAGRRASQAEGATWAGAARPSLLRRARRPGRAELRAESRELPWGPRGEGLLRTLPRRPGSVSLLFRSRRVLRAADGGAGRTQGLEARGLQTFSFSFIFSFRHEGQPSPFLFSLNSNHGGAGIHPRSCHVRLVKAMVFPVVMYGCESWTVKKAERRRIDACELWCWRRLLRFSWTARRSNQSVLNIHWKD